MVTVLCSNNAVYQIDLLNEKIDIGSVQILVGLECTRTIEDVASKGDIYLFPTLVLRDLSGHTRFEAAAIEHIVTYLSGASSAAPTLLFEEEFVCYRQHWDLFGLSPASFASCFINVFERVFSKHRVTVGSAPFSAGAVEMPGGDLFAFVKLRLDVIGDDGQRDGLVVWMAEPAPGINGRLVWRDGDALMMRSLTPTLDVRRLVIKNNRLHEGETIPLFSAANCFASSKPRHFSLSAFCSNLAIPGVAAHFIMAASFYCPFTFATTQELANLAKQIPVPPLIVVGHLAYVGPPINVYRSTTAGAPLVVIECVLIYNSATTQYIRVTNDVIEMLLVALDTSRGAMLQCARDYIKEINDGGGNKRKQPAE